MKLILNPVSWQKKPMAAQAYTPRPATKAQLGARIALAEEATRNFGAKGKIAGLPVVAAKAKAALAGKGHGGKTLAQRREESHSLASASIAAMKAKMSAM
jgi:hypothetical protein